MLKNIIVNIFGGPNSGKTTLAAELFVRLKKSSIDTEIVSEFAKDLILENNISALDHQWYVLANQAYRIMCSSKTMQVVITDSPILLGIVYDKDASEALKHLCIEQHNRYNNINILIERKSDYKHTLAGRVHSLTQSVALDNAIYRMLNELNISYLNLSAMGNTPISYLHDMILSEVNEKKIH